MDSLGRLATRLGDVVPGAVRRRLAGAGGGRLGAMRRYRRRLAETSSTLSVRFEERFDLPLADAYMPVGVATRPDALADRVEILDPWTAVSTHRGTLVLGPPGSGKSTVLRYLGWSSSIRATGGTGSSVGATPAPGTSLVVPVPLDRVEQLGDVTAALVDSFEHHGLPAAGDVVRRELGRREPDLLVLFDGLDEVRRDERARVAQLVAGFATRHPKVRFVVTCRTQAYHGELDGVVDQTVHVQPPSDAMIERFVQVWPGMGSPPVVGWLASILGDTPSLASLLRNPLVLTRLAALCSTTYRESASELLHDRRRLCREVVELLLSGWKPEHNRERVEVKKAVLQRLAVEGPGFDADPPGMLYEEVLAEARVVLHRYDREPGKAAEVVDEIIERSGLLHRLDGGERHQFAHRAIQQYFVALGLRDQPREVLRRYHADRDEGRPLLEVWCGGEQDSTEVINDLVDEGDTATALACLASAAQLRGPVVEQVVDRAKSALADDAAGYDIVRSWAHYVASSRPDRRAGFDFLASRAGSPRAAAALALSYRPEAAELLAQWAAHDPKMLPHLGRMGPVAVPALVALAAKGNLAAAQWADQIVNSGLSAPDQGGPSPQPGLAGIGPGAGGPPERRGGPLGAARPARSPRPRVVVPLAVGTVAVLALAALAAQDRSGGDPDRGESAAASDEADTPREGAMELVWSTRPEVHVASDPVLVGGNVVAHVVDGDGLALVGYDPASGTEVWRRPSTGSGIPTGIVLFVVADGDRVFHMSPGQGDSASIEAVDATTGEPVWRTEPSPDGFGDPVDFCSDTSLCVSALAAGSAYQRWTIDAATGDVTGDVASFRRPGFRRPHQAQATRADPTQAPPIQGRSLGYGLVDLYPSRDIALVVDGRIVWQRAPSELFGGQEVSSDYGWAWRRTDDLLVGWLGTAVDVPEFGTAEVVPQYTAGIDVSTGETVWVAEGDPLCGDRLSELDLSVNDTEPWLRCRITGTLEWEDRVVTGADVDTVMEGYDPATGEATWTAEIEGASGLYVDSQPLVRFGRASFALTLDDGSRFALDVATGRTSDVDPDTVGWCFTDNTYQQAESPDPTRIGPDFTTPCDLTGQPHSTPAEPDDDIGIQVDGIFIWMDADGLHGARLR